MKLSALASRSFGRLYLIFMLREAGDCGTVTGVIEEGFTAGNISRKTRSKSSSKGIRSQTKRESKEGSLPQTLDYGRSTTRYAGMFLISPPSSSNSSW